MILRPLAAVVLLLVAGCAETKTAYPSLAPRAAETLGFDEPVRHIAAAEPDPALDRQIAALDARSKRIAGDFAAAARVAAGRAAAARGRPAGSEPWLEAQTALAGLDDLQAQQSDLATDIEQLAIGRAATLAPTYGPLTAVGDRVDADLRRQGETIATLQGSLVPA